MVTILSVDTLRHALDTDPSGYTVVDARPRDDFLRGHIPGALSIEWEEWCGAPPPATDPVLAQPGYWGTLIEAAPAWYAERLSRCGIASERPIVVYADGARSKGREGRVAWMLLYLGARDVALLDGGWTGWRAGGGDITADDARPRREAFAVAPREERRWTHAHMAGAYREGRLPILVDTRTPSEFVGDCYDYLPRKGRLPGALLFPFSDLFAGPHGYVGRRTYLTRLPAGLHSRKGGRPRRGAVGDGLVAYCEVGVRASLMALLHEAYTGEVVGVFDGSLIEWALHADLPVHGPPRS